MQESMKMITEEETALRRLHKIRNGLAELLVKMKSEAEKINNGQDEASMRE